MQIPTTSRRHRSKLPLTVRRADSITANVTRGQAIQNSPILKAVLLKCSGHPKTKPERGKLLMIIFRIFNGFTFMYFHIVKIQGELFNLHTGAKNHNESKNSHVENRIFQENSHVKNHTFSHSIIHIHSNIKTK